MKIVRSLAVSLVAFGTIHVSAHADVPVVVSIKPLHSLVSGVMEGVGTPSLIVQGASSPHTYSLTPTQAKSLQRAKLIFWVGHELEAFLEKPISTLGAGAKQIELLEAHGLTMHEMREGGSFEEHAHEHEASHKHTESHDHDHGKKDKHGHGSHAKKHADEIDVHLWLDPINAKAIVHEVAEALSEFDPKNAGTYTKNEKLLSDRLDALITEVHEIIAPVRGRGFIVFHDAYQYFEKRFDIEASGSITINPAVPPSIGRVQDIRKKIRSEGAACVFSEPQFEPKIIKTVTEGTSAQTGVLDPLGAGLNDGPDLYFELIRNMAKSLRECLSR
jgi:zinc transport system substrate-binding protein